MDNTSEPFQRNAVRPMECFRAGWKLIKDKYWLFFGITVLGYLIASLGPMGVLAGPAMCGIYYCLLRHLRGEPVKFEMLFKGFDYFIQSLIAALLMMIPIVLILLPGYILMFVVMATTMPQQKQGAPPPDASAMGPFLIAMVVFMLLAFVVIMVISVLFMFTYPLIVDRKMKGVDALKMSYRAAMANLGGLLGLVLLSMLFSMLGTLACCVGTYFLIPIHFAAYAVAYRQVFPSIDEPESRDEPGADLQALRPQD